MAKNGEINSESYKKALKIAEQLDKKQADLKKSSERLKGVWDGISSSILGISGASWFKEVPKTTQDIQKQLDTLGQMKVQLQSMASEIQKAFGKSMGKSIEDNMGKLKEYNSSLKSSSDIIYGSILGKIKENGDAGIKLSEDLYKTIQDMSNKKKKFDDLSNQEQIKFAEDYKIKIEDIRDIEKEIEESKESSEKIWKKIEASMTNLSAIEDEGMRKKLVIALAEEDISKFIKEQGHGGVIALKQAGMMNKEVAKMAEGYLKSAGNVKAMEDELKKATKTQFSFSAGIMEFVKNIAKGILPRIHEFDKTINDTQKNYGINMDENATKMTNLVIHTSQFGMSVADTGKFMGELSDTLRTTDFNILAEATKDMAAFQLATGISSESLASMTGELMRMGKSTEGIKESLSFANISAKMFGVNTRRVLENISKNIVKMRTMGFVGGEKSLARMAAQAERLGQNVDEIFNVAEKTRSIEGAMEAAAELQLAGGSFSNINPMDLLSAARKGPEELNKLLTSMGKDVGGWVKKMDGSEEFQFDPVDVDRLKIVSQATGESMESLTNRIRKQAEDSKKLSLIPDSVFSGAIEGMDDMNSEMAKSAISDMIEMGKNGKIEIKADSQLAKMGFRPEDISTLNKDQIKAILEKKKADNEDIEKQAKENQTLMDSLTAFKDAIINVFTFIQPAVAFFTKILQWFGDVLRTDFGKWAIRLTAALLLLARTKAIGSLVRGAGALTASFTGLGKLFKPGGFKAFGEGLRNTFVTPKAPKVADTGSITDKVGRSKAPPMGMEKGFKSLARGLKAMGDPKVLAGVGVTILAVPALIALVPAIPGLLLMALVGKVGKFVTKGFQAIANGFGALGRGFPKIALGVAALALIAIALAGVGLAIGLFVNVEWETMAKAGVALIGLVAILAVVGALASAVGPLILTGALALIVVAGALAIVALSLAVFAEGMNDLATVNWGALENVGAVLAKMSLGLMAFAIAGLFFLNPIMLLGMMLMIGVLGMMSAILVPLAESLDSGASALGSMATSVQKLNESLGKLDFDKLEKLKEISDGFAQASFGGTALAGAMEKLASAINGGKGGAGTGGAGGTKTLVVQLRLPDGKLIQEQIVRDIEKVS